MTREEAVKTLTDMHADDPESAHSLADEVLCALLVSLGYGDVVEAWNKIEKWYA